jgi:hypothetical protein
VNIKSVDDIEKFFFNFLFLQTLEGEKDSRIIRSGIKKCMLCITHNIKCLFLLLLPTSLMLMYSSGECKNIGYSRVVCAAYMQKYGRKLKARGGSQRERFPLLACSYILSPCFGYIDSTTADEGENTNVVRSLRRFVLRTFMYESKEATT